MPLSGSTDARSDAIDGATTLSAHGGGPISIQSTLALRAQPGGFWPAQSGDSRTALTDIECGVISTLVPCRPGPDRRLSLEKTLRPSPNARDTRKTAVRSERMTSSVLHLHLGVPRPTLRSAAQLRYEIYAVRLGALG